MKARGEKASTIVDVVLAGRTQAFRSNCTLLCRNGAKEGIKELRRFSAKFGSFKCEKISQNGYRKV